ncbi:MAG: RIP metalloprotease RseP [Candidatus Liptonbacteria bacterium]|nr:RIP metalloprotease RseP [Candidatus Liptonbacteria bacterium]
MLTLIFVVAGLSALIIIHEAGHFFAAKLFRLRVNEFGFGFPPRLFAKKKGETEYSVNALPFGGFVQIAGENDHMDNGKDVPSPEEKKRYFSAQPAWKRSVIVLAGVCMNFAVGWLVFSLILAIGTPPLVFVSGVQNNSEAFRAGFKEGDLLLGMKSVEEFLNAANPGVGKSASVEVLRETEKSTIIFSPRPREITEEEVIFVRGIEPGSPAAEVGITERDVIQGFSRGDAFVNFLESNRGTAVTISVTRGGKRFELNPRVRADESRAALGVLLSHGRLVKDFGLVLREYGAPPRGLLASLQGGFAHTRDATWLTVTGVSELARSLVTEGALPEGIAGPVGIFTFASEASQAGFVFLLNLLAVISVNLAVINLMPFPALDGGRFFLLIIEKLKGSPISRTAEAFVNTVGFAVLIFLMVVITIRDIIRL